MVPLFRVPRIWTGATAVCIASGPSLTVKQLAQVYRAKVSSACRVIAVSDNYLIAPWADVLYSCDITWWDAHSESVCGFYGEIKASCMRDVAAKYPDVKWIPYEDNPGLSQDPALLHSGCNSGYQAVNLAALLGARKICLIGYDHRSSNNGGKHWFGAHPQGLEKTSDYNHWIKARWRTVPDSAKRAKVDIVNCSEGSALTMFRQSKIGAEL